MVPENSKGHGGGTPTFAHPAYMPPCPHVSVRASYTTAPPYALEGSRDPYTYRARPLPAPCDVGPCGLYSHQAPT